MEKERAEMVEPANAAARLERRPAAFRRGKIAPQRTALNA
jgi:hypothetical protein